MLTDAILSQRGGVEKTTLALNPSVVSSQAGTARTPISGLSVVRSGACDPRRFPRERRTHAPRRPPAPSALAAVQRFRHWNDDVDEFTLSHTRPTTSA